MPEVVTLEVDGRAFEGWTSVTVDKGLQNPAGAFALTYAARSEDGAPPAGIKVGAACRILIGGEPVIGGFVDATDPAFDAHTRRLAVAGRDKAADLVDCSALNSPGSWRGRTLGQIATDLLVPFGLDLSIEGDAGEPFKSFALQQGESAWDALERLTRFRGLMLTSDGEGGIRLIRPGARRASFTLRQGETLLALSGGQNHVDRFARYLVKGQAAGDDEVNGPAAATPQAEAGDPGARPGRTLMIVAEEQATLASLRTRAAWEANVRAARSETWTVTVQGWRDPSGALWSADLIVPIEAPWAGLNGDQLIVDVGFRLDPDGGSTTQLTCQPPAAWTPEPPPAEATS
jgi:prophage tail gpP-like protein